MSRSHASQAMLDVIGASGAALDHPDPSVRAGFNSYEIPTTGVLTSVEAHVIDPRSGALQRTAIAGVRMRVTWPRCDLAQARREEAR